MASQRLAHYAGFFPKNLRLPTTQEAIMYVAGIAAHAMYLVVAIVGND